MKQNERRFEKSHEFKRQYLEFMADYIKQGHMTLLTRQIEPNEEHYFIPHHGIDNKKFRVVFDGSCVTSSGVSCNDIQLIGERRQDNLTDILLRFRLHRIALTADIKQIYRQILIEPKQRMLQLILWRESPKVPMKVYMLNTVTYGMRHAPHSAIRAVQQCIMDHQNEFPKAAAVASNSFYVDDLPTGADSEEEAIELHRELHSLMLNGGFPLCKWTSNSWPVLQAISQTSDAEKFVCFKNDNEKASVLGIYWNPMNDIFQYEVDMPDLPNRPTKRQVASAVAKLFDPTGLLGPVIIRGKIILRDLWANQIGWDEEIPQTMVDTWNEYHRSLHMAEKLKINRWIGATTNQPIILHGFCDASENAYAAAIYYHVRDPNNFKLCTGLLTAKTKVAPVGKKQLTIPRLELNSTLLLSRLMTTVTKTFSGRCFDCVFWSDSTIALSWIKQSPSQQKTFVANRVAEIQELTEGYKWNHIAAHENPADVASRGTTADLLQSNTLWWKGPDFLSTVDDDWPWKTDVQLSQTENESVQAELKPLTAAVVIGGVTDMLSQTNSFPKLVVRMAYILRFIKHGKQLLAKKRENGAAEKRVLQPISEVPPLKRHETIAAEIVFIKLSQRESFIDELAACEANQPIATNSSLRSLNPFIAEDGLLRVGGRLENTSVPWNERHSIIIDGFLVCLHIPCSETVI